MYGTASRDASIVVPALEIWLAQSVWCQASLM
jgi:hypothetical protein